MDDQGAGAVEVLDDEEDAFEAFNRGMGANGDFTPYPLFVDLRAKGAVHDGMPDLGFTEQIPGENPTYTAYTYESVQSVLADGETFSSSGYAEVIGTVMGRTILQMDEPEHKAYRHLLQQAFTRASMKRWETELVTPLVHDIIDSFVDDQRVDLVRTLFFPLPVQVIAALLGLPEADIPEFHRRAIEIIALTIDMDRATRAAGALGEYLAPILAERRANPREDMISILAQAEQDGQHLTDEEIFSFCRLLLPAGAETTYRSSSNLLFGLLTNPDQLRALIDDRELLPQAIDEGIRWEPPLLTIVRSATRDTEVAGVAIPEGATMAVNMGAANHDESRWDDPESFDIFRERRANIGFGHGNHLCLGMHLARMETTAMFTALFDRLPNLRLDPDAPEPYITGHLFRAPPRLDVIWD